VTPSLTFGGQISYGLEKQDSKRAFAGIYDDGVQMVQGLVDKDVRNILLLLVMLLFFLFRMLYLPRVYTDFQRCAWVISDAT